MAENLMTSSVKNFLVSLPSCFMELKANFQDIFCVDESSIQGLGSNTLLISERTAKTLNLSILDDCKTVWLVLELSLIYSDSDKINSSHGSKRLIQVFIDSTLSDDYIILSEDLVYNLEYSLGLRRSCHLISSVKPKELCITNVSNHAIAPFKAKKVIISPLQCEATLEDHSVDMILQSYFEIPRYLCKNDVFGVCIPSYIRFDSINNIRMDLIYFKVCDIEGNQYFNKKIHDTSYGYLVDSSASIYQVSNTQDLYPVKRFIAGNVLINELLNDAKLLKSIKSRGHNLIPECFEGTFQVLGNWTEPFLCGFKHLQDFKLNPIFLLSGPNGSGKTMLMEALGAYFGINYWRIDCVTLGEQIPGQVEAKLKMVFSKLNTISPCILHFSNIQALFEDEGGKVDVRVLASFEQQMRLFKPKLPVILMASTSNLKSLSSNVNQLFMDSTTLSSPNQTEREEILLWLVSCRRAKIDEEVIQTVGAQTSGFLLRDLEILVSLAFKEKINRTKGQITNEKVNFVYSDFSKIIGLMRMMFSESIGAPKVPSVSWKDVGGLEHLKKEILRSLRSNLFSAGLKRSGLLLHGPPGTGKTLLAKAVATQCGRNFLSVKGPELLNMYVGQSEQNVRDLFELAKTASPCIIFFDELDSLAPNRGRSGDSGGVMDRVVSQLLAEMDSLNNCVDIFILGATNRPDLIDPALLRPGRLDKMLYVGPCEDKVSQLSVLTALTRKLKLSSDVDLAQLVSRLPSKVSGAQLSALCSAAWLSSARQTILAGGHLQDPEVLVSQKHFLAAVDSAL